MLINFVVNVLIIVISIYDILMFFVVFILFIEWMVIKCIIIWGWLKYFNF